MNITNGPINLIIYSYILYYDPLIINNKGFNSLIQIIDIHFQAFLNSLTSVRVFTRMVSDNQ